MEKNKAAVTPQKGFSVKTLTAILVAAAILALGASYIEASDTITGTKQLYELEKERQSCDFAIQRLMDGSDYLTSQAEQYVVKGDRTYMDNYWSEVDIRKTRDTAIDAILAADITDSERAAALSSKARSDELMKGETWAMRMVAESEGMTAHDMPIRVVNCELGAEDAALSANEKREAAITYMFGPEYTAAKESIRSDVNNFRNEIANRYGEAAMAALETTTKTSWQLESVILIFFFIMLLAVGTFAVLVLLPLMRFSKTLATMKDGLDTRLDDSRGALEVKKFASVFNYLYSQVKENTERLRRLGYYDYLTDVPNRASITEYVESAINNGEKLGLMILDIDNFKRFNDTFGHAIGDRTLQAVAKKISLAYSMHSGANDSGVAGRLCGEEFVLVEKNATKEQLAAIAKSALENVRAITPEDAGLIGAENFSVTVSIGGMLFDGESGASFTRLLSKADKALYISKTTGKDKYTQFEEIG